MSVAEFNGPRMSLADEMKKNQDTVAKMLFPLVRQNVPSDWRKYFSGPLLMPTSGTYFPMNWRVLSALRQITFRK